MGMYMFLPLSVGGLPFIVPLRETMDGGDMAPAGREPVVDAVDGAGGFPLLDEDAGSVA